MKSLHMKSRACMNNSNFVVRHMTPGDVNAVAKVASESFFVPWQRSDFEFSVNAEYDIGLVAECEGKVIGFCILRCSIPQADVIDVAVTPEARGAGVGTAMIERLLFEGEKKGVSDFMLEVRESNIPAIKLYENVGFKVLCTREKYYSAPVEDALVMQCISH